MKTTPRALRPLYLLAIAALALPACKSDSSTPPASPAFTLHYHRAASDYTGWTVAVSAGASETSATSASTDGFGAVYALTVKSGAPKLSFKVTSAGGDDTAGSLDVDVSGSVREAWVFSGSSVVATGKIPAVPAATGEVVVYYSRVDGIYTGWGLHTWGDVVTETQWGSPLQSIGTDPVLGAGFVIKVPATAAHINVIAHKGDTKDPGPDMGWDLAALGKIVFISSGSATITTGPVKAGGVSINGAAAHLIARDTLVWDVSYVDAQGNAHTNDGVAKVELRYSATAGIAVVAGDVTGGTVLSTTVRAAGLTDAQKQQVPHLALRKTYDLAAGDLAKVKDSLKGQLVAVARKADGTALAATQVQTAFAIDDLYSYDGALGVTWAAGVPTFNLWAPTAQTCKLYVYDASKAQVAAVDMTAGASGLWTTTGQAAWKGNYYKYELDVYHYLTGKIEHVKVTDPYAVNLDTNGNYAQLADLSDPALQPAGWSALVKPALEAPEDIVIYEGHIRDFSVLDATTPSARRGKYLGFVTDAGQAQSNGLKHLQSLATAGLTHFHLLPAFDFATIEEDATKRVDIDQPFSALCAKNTTVPAATCTQYGSQTILDVMKSLAGDSEQQQNIATWMAGLDGFNWGYDPFHYGAPEGSYASTAEGTAKIVEFRQMVKGLSDVGLRVVLDVVYNHTNAAGIADKSVLDKVVPGYYHRFDADTGFLKSDTCCADTATEHHMMEKLMVDTVVQWAVQYKIDAFRFDLMGFHMKSNMLKVQSALQALTLAHDGVDGSKIYLYGEGWDYGAVQANARGTNASQVNMAGTGIGTFNDRLRDAGRGGSPFDNGASIRQGQGFSSGLYTDPNELETANATADKALLIQTADWIKAGLAGGLRDFKILSSNDVVLPTGAIGYRGAPTGYTLDPQETINYVSAHDNQTLFDIIAYKYPSGRSMAERVRSYNLSIDLAMLAEGVPFFHMGDDLLRSKSMEGDSYNSGDWFNKIDFSFASNGWKIGLPNQSKNGGNWPLIKTLFGDASLSPGAADITAAKTHFQEMLKVRKSTRLLRLTTKDDVMKRVDFLNAGSTQIPGVLVMTVTDDACGGADLDPNYEGVVVIFNGDKVSHDLTVPGATGYTLHPVLAASADSVVKTASAAGNVFTVPARTTALFAKAQSGARLGGLPCNTR